MCSRFAGSRQCRNDRFSAERQKQSENPWVNPEIYTYIYIIKCSFLVIGHWFLETWPWKSKSPSFAASLQELAELDSDWGSSSDKFKWKPQGRSIEADVIDVRIEPSTAYLVLLLSSDMIPRHDSFQAVVDAHDFIMVNFYADWCLGWEAFLNHTEILTRQKNTQNTKALDSVSIRCRLFANKRMTRLYIFRQTATSFFCSN